MIDLDKIAHTDCDVVKRYNKSIDSCTTLSDLKTTLSYWKPLAEDAYDLVNTMNKNDFKEFRVALKKERKGVFSYNDHTFVICLPQPMFDVSKTVYHFKVPFGCALHRMKDLNVLNRWKEKGDHSEKD